MTQEFVIHLAREATLTVLLVSAPILILGLIAGLAIGIFQAVTQIHEMTLTFIPKILISAIALIIFAPWMLNVLLKFTTDVFTMLPTVAR
ncbi:MAG: flagellar biosynthesis protein FliQ [Candidatus Latescibacteria bacterium]|nr:flagellar biosynthesis protein FliQ [Candidatus Latescibacterota bacterium]